MLKFRIPYRAKKKQSESKREEKVPICCVTLQMSPAVRFGLALDPGVRNAIEVSLVNSKIPII